MSYAASCTRLRFSRTCPEPSVAFGVFRSQRRTASSGSSRTPTQAGSLTSTTGCRDFRWLGLADHRIAAEETIEIGANWKILMEGGLESYHFRVAHRDTIGPYFADNLLSYQVFGPHLRSVLPRVSMPDLRQIP